jgi:multiple sugar transport system ATP-binding protein
MGSPSMNMFEGIVAQDGASLIPDALPSQSLRLPSPLQPGRKVVLGIRPEKIGGEAGENVQRLDLPVEIVEPTGSDVFLWLRFGRQQLSARLPASAQVKPGETITVWLDLDSSVVFDADTRERVG